MNELGLSLLWLAGQVTLLCIVTAAIYLIARRRHPSAGATTALSGLLLCALLTLGIFSPWPRWSLHNETRATNESVTSASDRGVELSASSETNLVRDDGAPGEATPPGDLELESASSAAWTTFWQSLGRELTQPRPPATDRGYRWTAWLAVSLLLAMGLGAVRLLAGWLAVRRCLRRSTLIDEGSLTETLDVLRAELGERRAVQLRESNEITSAATVGWRRPVILLPTGWRDWSAAERRIVLAHELAHVRSSDAATWLAAQVGLLLHFYHPLVHWLAHRLRLEQELAADAVAARLTGSPQSYLTSLAELAVRQPDRPLAWPARAFLPTRGTLLRRIEMLRDTKSPPLRSSTWRRATVIALTLAAGVFVAGLRPPGGEEAVAQETAKPQAGQGGSEDEVAGGFKLEHVPGSTKALIGLRPAQIASRPEMAPLVKAMNEIDLANSGLRIEEIDQVLCIFARPVVGEAGAKPLRGPVIEVRMKEPTDFTAYAKNQHLITNDGLKGLNAHPDDPQLTAEQRKAMRESDVFRRQFLTAIREEDTEGAGYIVDDRTILYGLGKDLGAVLDDLDRKSVGRPDWLEKFETVENDHACVVGDVTAFRTFFRTEFQDQPTPIAGMFMPLLQNADLAIAGVRFEDTLPVTVHGWAPDATAAAKLEQALLGLVPLGRGMLESTKASLAQQPEAEEFQAMLEESVAAAEAGLDTLNIETTGNQVTVSLTGEAGSTQTLVTALASAVLQSREAARRTQSKNNLKQIATAFHSYHVVFGHFPPPTLYGPDGKTPHSWRVELLPILKFFVDKKAKPIPDFQQIDREAYNKLIAESGYDLSQPWDSEQNRKVLEQIPALFRHPTDDADSTNTAYFALVGEHTALGNTPGKGVELRDITDGTKNTLMIVEAKRDIPWTKPVDIPYSPDEDLPKLGGYWTHDGFFAGFADGAVRYIANAIDEATLRNLITRDDGIPIPAY